MSTTCPICALPKARVKKINEVYKAGHPIDEIGLAYSLSIGDLTTHFETCSLVPENKTIKFVVGNKDIKEEFCAKDKYSKLIENLEEVLARSYQGICSYNEDKEAATEESGGDYDLLSPVFKYDNMPKLQTAYAKLVDTYTKVIKDIENQKNEEEVIQGLLETVLNPLMQSMVKMIIEELDSLKSELGKHGELNIDSQRMFTECFKKIGTKTKNDMEETIDKLYKFYKISRKDEEIKKDAK